MKYIRYVLLAAMIQFFPIIIVLSVVVGVFSFDMDTPFTMAVAEGDVYWDIDHPIDNVVTTAILVYLDSENYRHIKQTQLDILQQESEIELPTHYLVVPYLLVGQLDPSREFLQRLKTAMVQIQDVENQEMDLKTGRYLSVKQKQYSLYPLHVYVDNLFQLEEFNTLKQAITQKTMMGYIQAFDKLHVFSSLPSEFLLQFKGDYSYPFASYQPVSALVGWYAPFGVKAKHNGVDFAAACQTPIYAITDGVVVAKAGTQPDANAGYFIRIQNKQEVTVSYLHLNTQANHALGQYVRQGDLIGFVGTTGLSTGCHLHLEMRTKNSDVLSFCDFIDCYNKQIGQ